MLKITTRPQVRRFSYKPEVPPVSDFLRTTVETLELAAWMFVNGCRAYEASVVQNGTKLTYKIGFTGARVHSWQMVYYYHKTQKLSVSETIAAGMPALKKFFASFLPPEIVEAILEGGSI